MIGMKVTVRNGYTSIEISGHAGYASHGHDIVCAAISAISHTAILGLQSVAEQYKDHVKIDIDAE